MLNKRHRVESEKSANYPAKRPRLNSMLEVQESTASATQSKSMTPE